MRHALGRRGGATTDLGDAPGGTDFSSVNDLKEAGQVVGATRDADGQVAFFWDAVNGMTVIGDFPGGAYNSVARAINESGVVVGLSTAADGALGFRWTEADGMVALQHLAGNVISGGFDINDPGQIVGYDGADGGNTHATLRRTDGTPVDLGDFAGGYNLSYANGINNAGQVVGYGHSDLGKRAFVRDVVAGLADLNDLIDEALGWTLTEAFAIDESGQILVRGTDADGADNYAVLSTPVESSAAPLPAAAPLMAAGLAALGFAARRRRG